MGCDVKDEKVVSSLVPGKENRFITLFRSEIQKDRTDDCLTCCKHKEYCIYKACKGVVRQIKRRRLPQGAEIIANSVSQYSQLIPCQRQNIPPTCGWRTDKKPEDAGKNACGKHVSAYGMNREQPPACPILQFLRQDKDYASGSYLQEHG